MGIINGYLNVVYFFFRSSVGFGLIIKVRMYKRLFLVLSWFRFKKEYIIESNVVL